MSLPRLIVLSFGLEVPAAAVNNERKNISLSSVGS